MEMKELMGKMREAQDMVDVPVIWNEDGAAVNPFTTKVQQVDNRWPPGNGKKCAQVEARSRGERAESWLGS